MRPGSGVGDSGEGLSTFSASRLLVDHRERLAAFFTSPWLIHLWRVGLFLPERENKVAITAHDHEIMALQCRSHHHMFLVESAQTSKTKLSARHDHSSLSQWLVLINVPQPSAGNAQQGLQSQESFGQKTCQRQKGSGCFGWSCWEADRNPEAEEV